MSFISKVCRVLAEKYIVKQKDLNKIRLIRSASSSDGKPPIPGGIKLYDSRKFGHSLPTFNVCTPFEPLPNIPTGIFRCTDGERLGPCAGKCNWYKNPEYFAFQHMTFFDLHLILRPCRIPSPMSNRKPVTKY